MKKIDPILLIGAGPMAIEYAKVLQKLNQEFTVVGRSKKSAEEFEKIIRVNVTTGGLSKFLQQNSNKSFGKAIVAVSEEQLGVVTHELIKNGARVILVEKPGGSDFQSIVKTAELSKKFSTHVYVAYNRRFYASVEKALEIIKTDGGVQSIFFDFTELNYKIAPLKKASGVKKNWFLHNSTHVIDLAFFIAGTPLKMSSFAVGKIIWHPKSAVFGGAGITNKNAVFSYHADWKAPGRWNIEIMTKKHKLFLKPLEKLQIQNIGSFEIFDIDINNQLDINFKPGIYKQVESFLGNKKNLCPISEQIQNLKLYQNILEGRKYNSL